VIQIDVQTFADSELFSFIETLTQDTKTKLTQLGERPPVSTAYSDMVFIVCKYISVFLIRVSHFPLPCYIEHLQKATGKQNEKSVTGYKFVTILEYGVREFPYTECNFRNKTDPPMQDDRMISLFSVV
jgi:hypothetical protein